MFGTLVAVAILGVLQNGFALLQFSTYLEDTVLGSLLIFAVLTDRLVRRAERERRRRPRRRRRRRDHERQPAWRAGPLLEARGITRRYGNVAALSGVDLQVMPGEVVGLVGDNGAGKSTLVKILCGAVQPTSGRAARQRRAGHLPLARRTPASGASRSSTRTSRWPPSCRWRRTSSLAGNTARRACWAAGVLDRPRMAKRGRRARWSPSPSRSTASRPPVRAAVGRPAPGGRGGPGGPVGFERAPARRADGGAGGHGVGEDRPAGQGGRQATVVGVVLVSHNMPQVHELCDRIVVLLRGRVVADLAPGRNRPSQDIVMWITGAALAKK